MVVESLKSLSVVPPHQKKHSDKWTGDCPSRSMPIHRDGSKVRLKPVKGDEFDDPEPNPCEDSFRMWLQQIGRTPLLNADLEYRLAIHARQGCRECKKAMIEANLRLVVNIAKRF